jgi:hypothetical protein
MVSTQTTRADIMVLSTANVRSNASVQTAIHKPFHVSLACKQSNHVTACLPLHLLAGRTVVGVPEADNNAAATPELPDRVQAPTIARA